MDLDRVINRGNQRVLTCIKSATLTEKNIKSELLRSER